MKRPGIGSVLSFFVNILLSLWLLNQYYYDQYFHNYVDSVASQNLPYLVLTIGIGGGSGFGYLILRRRHSETSIARRLQKARTLRQSGPLPSPSGNPLQSRNVPVGTPPGPASKHTAYAVPSLSKASTPTVQKTTPSTSWSMTPKQPSTSSMEGPREQWSMPSATPKQPPPQFSTLTRPEQAIRETKPSQLSEQRSDPTSKPFSTSSTPGPGEGLSRIPPPSALDPAGKQWGPGFSKTTEAEKASIPYARPFPEGPARPQSGFTNQPSGEGMGKTPQTPPTFQSLKSQASDQGSRPVQWTDPVPRQGYSPPQKWSPPSVSPVPGSRPQTPMGPPPRPGQAPQGRPMFPGPQGPPRPLAYAGAMRPPPPGGTPGTFRPDQPRPSTGAGGQQRPPIPSPRPIPAQWNPQSEEKKETSSSPQSSVLPGQQAPPARAQPQSVEPPAQTTAPGASSGGEMDWDTALDTILKTLRKDKVGDKP